jgi:hypothetical protein
LHAKNLFTGLANIARELIKGGANIEAKANYGQETPLFFAAESGTIKLFVFLFIQSCCNLFNFQLID